MAEVILNCPQCQRSLRVTDDLLGRPVKCPACGMTFTVSPRPQSADQGPPLAQPVPEARAPQPAGQSQPMSPEEGRPHREGWSNWTEEETRQNARAYAVPPGVCLIVVALLGCFMDLAQVVMFAVISENAYDRMPKFFGQNEPLATVRPPAMIVGGAGACLSLVILLAGIQTCRLRTYPFAVLGAVLAMLNCVNLCCALGLPAGLWSFIILMRQDVRAGFQ